ncbi:hypothetical protein GGF42_002340 [Coemansia sp. RSA 2424]|nr:hypothetical protein GGF42_002340 [Coemansia sp. RSA 2424]
MITAETMMTARLLATGIRLTSAMTAALAMTRTAGDTTARRGTTSTIVTRIASRGPTTASAQGIATLAALDETQAMHGDTAPSIVAIRQCLAGLRAIRTALTTGATLLHTATQTTGTTKTATHLALPVSAASATIRATTTTQNYFESARGHDPFPTGSTFTSAPMIVPMTTGPDMCMMGTPSTDPRLPPMERSTSGIDRLRARPPLTGMAVMDTMPAATTTRGPGEATPDV